MSNTPMISVIMSVYNTEEIYLKEAIESILNQTYSNFEFIIIDDASDYNVKETVREFRDPRIIFMRNHINLGLPLSLNRGLEISKGEFIARMDADDISKNNRLENQLNYFESNKEVDILGTTAEYLGNKKGKVGYVESSDMLKARLIFNSSIIHPSCMIKKEFLTRNKLKYNSFFLKAQDYDLWSRCLEGGFAVLPEPLLLYRTHDKQASANKKEQNNYGNIVRKNIIKTLGINPTEKEFNIHFELINPHPEYCYSIQEVDEWCLNLIQANNKIGIFDRYSFNKVIIERFVSYLFRLIRKDVVVCKDVFKLTLFYKALNPVYHKMFFDRLIRKY